jgi:methionine-rich copper-binding protein CopC
MEKAESESAKAQHPAPPHAPTRAERFRAFWSSRAGAAVGLAVVIIAGSWFWYFHLHTSSPQTFATLTLTAGVGNRAEGPQAVKVPLPLYADALRISLMLPEGATPAASYRVELVSDNGETKPLEVTGQDARSVSVVIPAARLARGQYALRLFATSADGAQQRVGGGSYFFTVE